MAVDVEVESTSRAVETTSTNCRAIVDAVEVSPSQIAVLEHGLTDSYESDVSRACTMLSIRSEASLSQACHLFGHALLIDVKEIERLIQTRQRRLKNLCQVVIDLIQRR